MIRGLALALVAVLGFLLVTGDSGLAARLQALVWPVAPGPMVEVTRPDLASPAEHEGAVYTPPAHRFAPHTFAFAGAERRYYLLPAQGTGSGLPPLVLLLHGSGRDGRAMLDMWQGVAGQGAMLLAPDARDLRGWNPAEDGPAFLTALLAQAAQAAPFDPAFVYVYGHSSGANMALYLGQCTDFAARAVAVHAGALEDCGAPHHAPARPYLIQIGDRDATFPLAAVRASAQGIAARGSPVTLEVIPGHGHWYYDAGPALAADAWDFFQRQ